MCAVLDLCGKVVLAWKIGADMTSSLVTDTIREALQTEKVTGGLALHSDQGSQYTSQAYFDLAQAYHVSPSMSSPGCPYDNAAMENFFGTLKTECLYRAHFTTRAEVEQLREWFLDKWHAMLTTKEFDYQYRHIGELCAEFELLKGENHDFKPGDKNLTGTRIRYLLLDNPALYRQIVPYEKTMESNRQIRQLVEVLGRNGRGEKLRFEALSGIQKEQLMRRGVPSDIEGIGLGDDLNHLLPVEYCSLSDEALYPEFALRYVEKRLQVFDSRSHEEPVSLRQGKRAVSGQGPYIVCIDTSGSMNGEREHLAKSAVLAIARLTENTHRKCVVINFAEEIQTMIIRDLRSGMPSLLDFLNQRFDGGTNLFPAIDESIRLVDNNGWKRSDIVWISDFEMPPLSDEYTGKIERLKRAGTSFYALVFGTRPETDYLGVCHRYWDMTIP